MLSYHLVCRQKSLHINQSLDAVGCNGVGPSMCAGLYIVYHQLMRRRTASMAVSVVSSGEDHPFVCLVLVIIW